MNSPLHSSVLRYYFVLTGAIHQNTKTRIYTAGETSFNVAECNVQLTQLTTGLDAELIYFICQSTLTYRIFLCVCLPLVTALWSNSINFFCADIDTSLLPAIPPLLLTLPFFSLVPFTQSVLQSLVHLTAGVSTSICPLLVLQILLFLTQFSFSFPAALWLNCSLCLLWFLKLLMLIQANQSPDSMVLWGQCWDNGCSTWYGHMALSRTVTRFIALGLVRQVWIWWGTEWIGG